MKCEAHNEVSPAEIDIPSIRAKYREERQKRIRPEGQRQYVRPSGDASQEFAADPHLPIEAREPISEDIDVIVLGGGFGGLLASYYLTKQGVTNFRNIDSAGDFGGVWYWNRYPGIQCDNESYCYLPILEETGFMPSKKFADGWEIQGYCREIAEQFGFAEQAVFHTLITTLRWDAEIQRWRIATNRGDEFRARFVVMACGVLNMPKLPGIPGINEFRGKLFHTARWDYDYTGGSYGKPELDKLQDKRVALVGTGATSIQAVPHLAEWAKELYVVQRTPSSVDERPNPPTDSEWVKTLQPGWQQERQDNFHRGAMEAFAPGEQDLICDFWTEISRNMNAKLEARGWPQLSMEEFMEMREVEDYLLMERMRRRVEQSVDDPETAEALKPYYRFMCKRPLSSNEYYPAFNRPNVKLIDVAETQGLERLTETGFVANGEEHEVDCVIFASGFEVTSDLERRWGMEAVEGRDGLSIYDHWRDGPVTLHGTMTHGFPNQFFVGYYQGGINASVTEQFGRQGEHIAYIIAEALRRGATYVEASSEAQDAYVQKFEEMVPDQSAFQADCPPSYFNNEGESNPKWGLFRPWGPGWNDFMAMLQAWRESGDLQGLIVENRE
ncbi:flavin-containing monooxygenase [Haliea sp. E17]|uniref:flavin-containing monooxygenase n=1 Tax=Haliea sp. E17 TaxID=3401576 RepID=UPI003AAF83FD